jgi:hypothetical protein
MENYTQLTREEKSQFWQHHFDRWKESNLSQKKYCEENSISYWNFKNRYSKLQPVKEATTKKFIKLTSENNQTMQTGKIEIMFANKIRLVIDESISESGLRRLFSAMGCGND